LKEKPEDDTSSNFNVHSSRPGHCHNNEQIFDLMFPQKKRGRFFSETASSFSARLIILIFVYIRLHLRTTFVQLKIGGADA